MNNCSFFGTNATNHVLYGTPNGKYIRLFVLWQISGSRWGVSEVSRCGGGQFIPRTVFVWHVAGI